MEILNQNKRRTAIWRIFGIGFFILCLGLTVVYSMHKNYSAIGLDEIEILKEEMKAKNKKWEAEKSGLNNDILKLRKELKNCKDDNDSAKRLQLCEDRIKSKDDRIDELDAELTRCEAKLVAATSY